MLRKNVVLALSCSTLDSLLARDAFDRLFTVKWLSRPPCIVNMAFLLVAGVSFVFACKLDSNSLKKVPREEREKILMRGLVSPSGGFTEIGGGTLDLVALRYKTCPTAGLQGF